MLLLKVSVTGSHTCTSVVPRQRTVPFFRAIMWMASRGQLSTGSHSPTCSCPGTCAATCIQVRVTSEQYEFNRVSPYSTFGRRVDDSNLTSTRACRTLDPVPAWVPGSARCGNVRGDLAFGRS